MTKIITSWNALLKDMFTYTTEFDEQRDWRLGVYLILGTSLLPIVLNPVWGMIYLVLMFLLLFTAMFADD